MRSGNLGRDLCLFFVASTVVGAACAQGGSVALKNLEKIPSSCRESPYGAGDWLRTTKHGGRDRRYIVHVPPGYDRSHAVPEVLFLHGGAGNAKSTREWVGWDQESDRKGFIVVYPDGAGPFKERLHSWNAGNCGGWAFEHGIDDVGFIRKVLDEMEQLFCIDRSRVYVTGISNGAMMSYRLASELSDRIAAIGPVAGMMCEDVSSKPVYPVSVMHIHGTSDEHEPYKGGKATKGLPLTRKRDIYRSVPEMIDLWTKYIGASEKPTSVETKGAATRYTHGGGRQGSEVVLWKIEGGGHTWPGVANPASGRILGKTSYDVSATDQLWKFFSKHSRQAGTSK